MKNASIAELYREMHTIAAPIFAGKQYPWEVLPEIGGFITELAKTLDKEEFDSPSPGIYVHKTASVYESACLTAPCIIDAGAEVRHCAFIRGNVIVGKNAVVGNSTELKNVILFDSVQVPHYNYVGDSVLGYKSHMGAGSITSNVKSDKTDVVIKGEDGCMETGRKKVGAMLGGHVEVGCGSVLNPGTVIGSHTSIYPLSSVRGVIPPDSIYKNEGETAKRRH